MVRRTRRWRAPKLNFDYQAAFIEAGKRIARGSGILHSYRKGSGMLLLENRSHAAQVSLQTAIAHSIETLHPWLANDWAKCWEHVGKHAMAARRLGVSRPDREKAMPVTNAWAGIAGGCRRSHIITASSARTPDNEPT